MDKRLLIMLESKHYLTVTIIWTKTAIASIMMRGTPEIQIKKKWNASIVLIALNVFVIRSKNKNQKYENTLSSMTKVNIKDNKRPIGHVSHMSKDSSNDKISFIES